LYWWTCKENFAVLVTKCIMQQFE